MGKLPIGFKDINSWIDGRKASKHNSHLQAIMKQLGCDTNEGFVQVTHAATINDTFWIKSDREKVSWEQISLYQNQFTEVISKLATHIGQMGINAVLRERVKEIKDFSFSFRGDDVFTPERVKAVEHMVRRQAKAILSRDKLYTKDVFFSKAA